MNLPTGYSQAAGNSSDQPVIQLEQVSVNYRLPQERISSIKEYAIRWLKGELRYNQFMALNKIDLNVNPGEILGIIGPNGAGKSTLLKVIARVLRPLNGRVRIRGRVSPLLELGAGFDAELTGRENVYLNSAILGFSKQDIDERFERIVQFAGLHDFIDAPVRTYSTGMAARLGFSVATDVQPEILIVDEILGVGDTEFQKKSFERIQSFQAAGTTILLVTHSLQKVREMCSRVIWLDHGSLVMEGDADQVVGQYLERNQRNEEIRLQNHRIAQLKKRDAPKRWGNHKAEIVDVSIQNKDGAEQRTFQTGDALILKISYKAHQSIPEPVFGMAIHRNDGVQITGPNTQIAGLQLSPLEGEGVVLYQIPHLPLLEGLYHISVAIVDWNDTEIYDFHNRQYSFRVTNDQDETVEKYGLMTVQGKWKIVEA